MRLAKNYLYLSAAELAAKVITFAAIAYLARVAGPVAYGYFEFAAAAVFCAGLIVDQGLGPYGAREIAKGSMPTADLVRQIVSLRVILAAIAAGALALFALAFEQPPLVTQLLLIYALDLMLMPLLLQWVFQGHDRMGTVAVLQLIRQAFFAIVIFAWVREPKQIWIVAVAEGVGIAGAVIYGLIAYHRRYGSWLQARLHVSWKVLRESAPIGASQIFWVVRMYGAILILGLVATPPEVGYFGAAMRIFVALHAFVYLYFFNQLASLARAWHARDASLDTLIAQSLRRVAGVCLFSVPVWILTSPLVIRIAYGPEFAPAAVPLAWLAVVFGFAWLDGHYRFSLIAAGYQHIEMYSQLFGSLVAAILIPVLYVLGGLGGVGIALVIGELVVWLIAWWYSRRELYLRGHAALLGRMGIAGLFAAFLIWVTGEMPLLARILLVELSLVLVMLVIDSQLRTFVLTVGSREHTRLRARLGRLLRLRLT